jgi:hypothetical protein
LGPITERSHVYELDHYVRDAIARDLLGLRNDLGRPITIDVDVWVETEKDAGYTGVPQIDAARIVVDEVINHQLVRLKLGESDELWDALKWALKNAKGFNGDAPDEVVAVFEAVHAALGFGA